MHGSQLEEGKYYILEDCHRKRIIKLTVIDHENFNLYFQELNHLGEIVSSFGLAPVDLKREATLKERMEFKKMAKKVAIKRINAF